MRYQMGQKLIAIRPGVFSANSMVVLRGLRRCRKTSSGLILDSLSSLALFIEPAVELVRRISWLELLCLKLDHQYHPRLNLLQKDQMRYAFALLHRPPAIGICLCHFQQIICLQVQVVVALKRNLIC